MGFSVEKLGERDRGQTVQMAPTPRVPHSCRAGKAPRTPIYKLIITITYIEVYSFVPIGYTSIYWSSFVAHWSSFEAHWSSFDAHWSSFVAHWPSFEAHSSSFEAHWSSFVAHWFSLRFIGPPWRLIGPPENFRSFFWCPRVPRVPKRVFFRHLLPIGRISRG